MARPLKVAFNGVALLSPLTGVGQYARCLSEELLATGAVKMNFFYASDWRSELRTTPVRNLGWIKRAVKRFVPHPYEVSRAVQNHYFQRGLRDWRPDVYHEPNFLPFGFAGPTVITVHDLSWLRFPQTHPADRVRIMRTRFPAAVREAAHLVVPTDFVRQEVMGEFGVAADRVTTTHEGARAIFHPRSADECAAVLSERGLAYRGFVLCVGTLEPRKNIEMVLNAYGALSSPFRARRPLVIVGMKGWLTSRLEALLRPMVERGDVRVMGYTPDDALAALYSAAQVLVYPSLYEGFGLPPLEAMASGTPVVVSDRASLPEVVGTAGVALPPDDIDGLVQVLRRFDEDSAFWQERAAAALARADTFSWHRCARETLAVYRRVADSS